jgi:hypothetical protein
VGITEVDDLHIVLECLTTPEQQPLLHWPRRREEAVCARCSCSRPDEEALLQNFYSREPDEGEQAKRARVSRLLGQWIMDECQVLGLPAIPARPWESLLDRIGEA